MWHAGWSRGTINLGTVTKFFDYYQEEFEVMSATIINRQDLA